MNIAYKRYHPHRKAYGLKLLLCFVLTLIGISSRQYVYAKASLIDSRNGLTSNNITVINKDTRGIMWIGTDNGLNIYDGYAVSRLTEIIGNTSISAIVNDPRRNLIWIGAANGLYQIDILTFNITKCRINNKASSVPILSVTLNEKSGDVYAVTQNGQIISLRNKEMASLGTYFKPLNSAITATCLDEQLLVYTGNLYKFSKKSVSLESIYDFENQMPFGTLTQYKDTIVAWSPSYGMMYINAASLTNITSSFIKNLKLPSSVRAAVLKEGKLYVSGGDYSLISYHAQNTVGDSISARYAEVFEGKLTNTIFVDEHNIIWVGTNKGIIKIQEGKQKFTRLLHDLTPRASTRNIIEDGKGGLYVGSYSGLYHYNKSDDRWTLYNNNTVKGSAASSKGNALCAPMALLADHSGRYLYYGYDEAGLFRFERNSKQFERIIFKNEVQPNGSIYALCYDVNGQIWMGTRNGLAHYDPTKGTLHLHDRDKYSVGNNIVYSIVQSHNSDILYIATSNGLYVLDISLGITEHYSTSSTVALSSNNVTSVYEDTNGMIWIGTNGGGVCILAANGRGISYLRRQNGLSNDNVYGILPGPEATYWISTYNGLCHYDAKTGIFKAYYEDDGISTNEFNQNSFLKTKEGVFYFGGINGITRFDATEINTNLPSFKIFATGINKWEASSESMRLSRAMIGDGETIIKRSADLIIELYFGCTDYADPLRNTYYYRISGLNDKWVSLEDRHILNLSGIPIGEYVVEVKAFNPRGTASANVLKFNLNVVQPFYKDWWFYLILLLGVGVIIFIVYRINIRTVKGLHQLRVKIASNLHDEVGSLLTRITMFSDNLRYGKNNEEQRNQKLEKIASLSRNATASMSDVLWAIDARNDFTGNLLDRMHEHAEEMLLPLQVNILFDTQYVNPKQYIQSETRRELYLIFKEAINNIAKHSHAQNVRVLYRQKEKQFTLLIENDGIGDESKNYTTGQGLDNMRLRARRINANFEQSVINEKFVIRIIKH
jgi:ligand-binding sensor domain-containing protein